MLQSVKFTFFVLLVLSVLPGNIRSTLFSISSQMCLEVRFLTSSLLKQFFMGMIQNTTTVELKIVSFCWVLCKNAHIKVIFFVRFLIIIIFSLPAMLSRFPRLMEYPTFIYMYPRISAGGCDGACNWSTLPSKISPLT